MTDLDTLFIQLRKRAVDPALASIEASVMNGLSRHREAALARRGYVLAGIVAVLVGAASTAVPSSSASAEPLLGMPENAPSHLLID